MGSIEGRIKRPVEMISNRVFSKQRDASSFFVVFISSILAVYFLYKLIDHLSVDFFHKKVYIHTSLIQATEDLF